MTGFTSAPWGLDGARSPASLARLANRAAVKQSGIITPGDLKVLPLSTPGNGVRIGVGGGIIDNRYISDSGQAYVVEATSEVILGSSENFTGIISQGSLKHHLICVSIGDPNYSMAGHPWLNAGNAPANPTAALDYQYVRAWVIQNVPLGTTRIEDLTSPPAYPVYALARIEVPASTTAITSGMIKDLRTVVNPRTSLLEWNGVTNVDTLSTGGSGVFEYFPDNSNANVYIPPWATHFWADAWLQGMQQDASVNCNATFKLGCITDSSMDTGGFKFSSQLAGRYPVLMAQKVAIPSNRRGTTCAFQIAGAPADSTTQGHLKVDGNSNFHIRLRFVEEAI